MTNTLPAWLEEWPQLQAISDVPAVHEALENFSHGSTEDAACLLIKEIARALLSEHVLCGKEPVGYALKWPDAPVNIAYAFAYEAAATQYQSALPGTVVVSLYAPITDKEDGK